MKGKAAEESITAQVYSLGRSQKMLRTVTAVERYRKMLYVSMSTRCRLDEEKIICHERAR